MVSRISNPARSFRSLVLAITVVALVGCSDETPSDPATDALLSDLQVVGIDFQLNSILLTNTAADSVRTENLYLCQEGECMAFNIFTIAPRATILFSVREVGGVDPAGGEVVLHASDDFDSPDSVLDYVAWGSPGHTGATAEDALIWNQADFVPTEPDTIILTKIDPASTGSDVWEASNEIP